MDSVKTSLILNEQEYDLVPLLKTLLGCPLIAVKVEELNKFTGPDVNKEHIVTTKPDYPQLGTSEIVFYKQHGAYTVIAGQDRVTEQLAAGQPVIKGRLVSSPCLKKYRVETPLVKASGVRAPYVDVLAHHARISNPPRFSPHSNRGHSFEQDYS
jgi:hypothetical protein